MPSVGTAYVQIRIDTKKFGADLEKMLAGVSKRMEKAGGDAGKSFNQGLGKTNFDAPFNKLTAASERASNSVVTDFELIGLHARDMGTQVSEGAGVAGSAMSGLRDEAADTGDAMGDLGDNADDASGSVDRLGGSGSRAGSGLRSGGGGASSFSKTLKNLGDEADKNNKLLRKLYNTAAFGGTALAGLVSAASAAGQAIFAVGANAAAAAPALAVMANGMMSLAQVGGVVMLAMKGVGDAIGAGLKMADAQAKVAAGGDKALSTAAASSARAVAAAMRSLRDAKDGLQDAYRDAARAAEDAARRTAQAERDLAEAVRATNVAQRELNDARREALEQLEDIGFAAEDAALAEERAALALQDAHQKLVEVSELAPDDRMRVEAELAFREAELNMRQAKDARQDADREQREAAKKGVKGTDAMKDARDNLRSAEEKEADARRDLADAQREEAETAVDNAEKIADARLAIRDAEQALADARKQSAAAADQAATGQTALNNALAAYRAELKKLAPQQREFVTTIVGMRKEFQDFSNAATTPLFRDLNKALEEVNRTGEDNRSIMDIVTVGLRGTSRALGATVLKASDLAQNELFQDNLHKAMKRNNQAIENLGGAVVNLVSAFVSLSKAAGPMFVEFTQWIEDITGDWARDANSNIDGLRETIETAGDRVKEFWGLIKQLWRWLKIVGGAANDAALNFDQLTKPNGTKGFIPQLTVALRRFNRELDHDDLVDGFTASLENLWAMGKVVGNIIGPLLDMGQSPALKTALETLGSDEMGASMDKLADTANEALPAMAELVVEVADFFAIISDTGSMAIFMETLSIFAGLAADIARALDSVSVNVGGVEVSLLKVIGVITGVTAALRIMWKVLKIGASPAIGIGKGVAKVFKKPQVPTTPTMGGPDEEAAARNAGERISDAFAQGLRTTGEIEAAMEAIELKVKTGFTEMSTTLIDDAARVGANIMEGLEIGLREGAAEATAAARRAGRTVADAVGDGAGTQSPSWITIDDGADIMEGLEVGIRQGTVEAQVAAKKAGATVARSVGQGANTAAPGVVAAGNNMVPTPVGGGAGAGAVVPPTAGKNVGKFSGLMGKFSKVLAPATKLLKPLSFGLRAVGAAFRFMMGPFGIVLMLLPILWPLLKKLEEKTGIFSKTLDVLTDAFMWLWEHALKPLIGFIKDVAIAIWEDLVLTFEETMAVIDVIVDGFQWLWDKIKELFNWVKNNWPKILIILTGPIGIAVALIIKHWDKIKEVVSKAVAYVVDYLSGMWDGITDGWDSVQQFFKDLWPVHIKPFLRGLVDKVWSVLKKFWDIIVFGFRVVRVFMKELWPKHIKPWIQNLIKKADTALSKFWNPIVKAWNDFNRWLKTLWPQKIKPWIDDLMVKVAKPFTKFWNGIVQGWRDLMNWFRDLWPVHLRPWIENLVEKASGKLDGFWNGLETGFKDTAKWIVDHMNSWLIDPINSALKKFGVSKQLPRVPMPAGLADGGLVTGRGGPREDNQLRRLSVGEYVLPAHITRAVGVRNLETLRKKGKLPPNTGGLWDTLTSGVSAGKDIVKSGVNSVTGAAAKGLAYALNWVIDQLADKVPDNMAGNFLLGMGKQVALALKDYATKADKKKAAEEKASKGGVYTGKPGGWTKPIIGSYYISQYPNAGHSPSWSVDLAAPLGRPITAASAGRVRSAISLTSSYGKYVVISHNGGVETLYAHLTNYIVKAGQKVKTGQVIGYLGSTGNSTGPHLHYEYKPSSSTVAAMAARGVRLAKGGVVAPSPDGTLALIAEAGKHERVTPLDSEGFTPAERRMLEALETSTVGGKGETFNVYPSQKMNEQELADKVARRVTWQRRRGAGSR